MQFNETAVAGVWVHSPTQHRDKRGVFEEQFKGSAISSALGRDFEVAQVNKSVSNKGVLRGIHWTQSAKGQAKYVSCVKGLVWDVYVDLRSDSKTFGRWGSEYLSLDNGKSIFISEGIGHAFLSLEDQTVVNYLCTSEYDPLSDRTLNPMDSDLSIPFLSVAAEHGIHELILSDKDRNAEFFSSIQSPWG